MKIKTRIICALLCVILLISTTACGKEPEKQAPTHLVVSLLTAGTPYADVEAVAAEVSKYMQEELDLNLEIEFLQLSAFEQAKYLTLLGGGETIDALVFVYGSLDQLYNVGAAQAITEEQANTYMKGIMAGQKEQATLVRSGEGTIIGVATPEYAYAKGGSYVIRKSLLEELGVADKYTDQKLISIAEFNELANLIKEKHPEAYAIGNVGSDLSLYFNEYDTASGYLEGGTLDIQSDINSTKFVNYFETSGYLEYYEYAKKWQKAGIIASDGDTSTESAAKSFVAGKAVGLLTDCKPSSKLTIETYAQEPCVQLQLVDPYTTGAASVVNWCVGGTSTHQNETLQFINAMMTDVKLMNMLNYGIEGTHFKYVDGYDDVLTYADGVTAETCGYHNALSSMGVSLFGDKRIAALWADNVATAAAQKASFDADSAQTVSAAKRTTKSVGFVFNSVGYESQSSAVNGAVKQYNKTLSFALGKGDEYDKMIKAQKAAGLDELLAAKQQQFDEWLKK